MIPSTLKIPILFSRQSVGEEVMSSIGSCGAVGGLIADDMGCTVALREDSVGDNLASERVSVVDCSADRCLAIWYSSAPSVLSSL